MATFRACVQKQRKDGFYSVYIRVTHRRSTAYIKTDKMITKSDMSSAKEIKDPFVLQYCSKLIISYQGFLNHVDISNWCVGQIVDYLQLMKNDLCFSDYARGHIDEMINRGQERNAKNYRLALQSMEGFFGTNRVMFSQLTSMNVGRWIASLASTARAKEMYPVCMRQVFRAATMELNDYDTGMIRITTNPWVKVKIPEADKPNKKAITAEACREFFGAPLPESKMAEPLAEMGRDVAMMVLCLAGINTIDLFNLRKADYHGGIIHYRRCKTTRSRSDDAYIEMRVPEVIKPLFEKYRADDQSDKLFNFAERYNGPDSFNANVNNGIKAVCKSMGMDKSRWYSSYTFRHTWATTAQNDCGATLSEIGFAMNHSQRQTRVTRGYVEVDFSPAWVLNEKVVEFILFTNKPSKRMEQEHVTEEGTGIFRLSKKMLIKGEAFFMGRRVANFEDSGCGTVDEAVRRLVDMLPEDIPVRSTVLFRIENLDNGKVAVYNHQKGKGF